MLFVDLGNLQQINLLQRDRDVILIVQPFSTPPWHVTKDSSFLNDDDEVKVSEEDDESEKEYAYEETDAENVIDIEVDDDNHSYHANDLD